MTGKSLKEPYKLVQLWLVFERNITILVLFYVKLNIINSFYNTDKSENNDYKPIEY